MIHWLEPLTQDINLSHWVIDLSHWLESDSSASSHSTLSLMLFAQPQIEPILICDLDSLMW